MLLAYCPGPSVIIPFESNELGGHAQVPVQVIVLGITQVLHTPLIRDQSCLQTQSSLVRKGTSFAGHEEHFFLSSCAYEPAAQYVQVTFDVVMYSPGSQSMHSADPVLDLYLPATHSVQFPGVPDQPALHVQKLAEPLEYAPVAQPMHTADPGLCLYVPGAQPAQKGCPGVHPALQMQAATALLTAGESEFAGQGEQAKSPDDGLYVPAAHCAHVPPSGRFHPALQTQTVTALLAAGETVFAGQP